jgi:hypothetical protein
MSSIIAEPFPTSRTRRKMEAGLSHVGTRGVRRGIVDGHDEPELRSFEPAVLVREVEAEQANTVRGEVARRLRSERDAPPLGDIACRSLPRKMQGVEPLVLGTRDVHLEAHLVFTARGTGARGMCMHR